MKVELCVYYALTANTFVVDVALFTTQTQVGSLKQAFILGVISCSLSFTVIVNNIPSHLIVFCSHIMFFQLEHVLNLSNTKQIPVL